MEWIMTYEEAREFINLSNQYGSVLGLGTITELLKRLGNPQEQLKIIHVAGTNGKGSTAAFIAAILAAEGYQAGRYLSPSVFSYREKIQISKKAEGNGNLQQKDDHSKNDTVISEYISKEGLIETIEEIKPVCEAMVRDGFAHPTSFEIETAMAFLYFCKQQVDFAVIEVGLGGRLDATNVIHSPICCVITSISMDHMQFLGDTIEKIAGEKAGIIKKGVPVVTGNNVPAVIQVLEQACCQAETTLQLIKPDQITRKKMLPEGTSFQYQGQEYRIRLLGVYQIDNALSAIQTANILCRLGYPISNQSVQSGLMQASWRGRFEVIKAQPYFILDGAHNEDAALELKKAIEVYFSDRRIIGIMGVFADKAYGKILDIMAPLLNLLITITPNNSRALASSQLAEEAKKRNVKTVIDANTIANALECAYQEAEKEDVIIAFGSLSFLGEIYENVSLHSDLAD